MACRGAIHLWVCSSSYGRADRTHRKWPGAHCSVRKTLSDITISSKRSSALQKAHKRGQLENNCICLRESSAFADVSIFVFQLATKEGYLVKQGAILKARAEAAFIGEANHCAVLKVSFISRTGNRGGSHSTDMNWNTSKTKRWVRSHLPLTHTRTWLRGAQEGSLPWKSMNKHLSSLTHQKQIGSKLESLQASHTRTNSGRVFSETGIASCAKFCPPFILVVEGGKRWKSITDLFHCGQFSGNKGALTFGDCAHFRCLKFQVVILAVMSILQFEKPIRTLDLRACSAVQFDYSHDRINCFWWVTSPCEQSGAKWVRRELWYTS